MIESVFDTQSNASEDNHLPNAEARSDIAAWLQREVTDDSDEQPRSAPLRYSRRLSDKILIAVHQSCDQGDIEIAWRLLDILDVIARRSASLEAGERRRIKDGLVAAHERLWEMRHRTLDLASIDGDATKLRLVPSVRSDTFAASPPESRVKSG